MKKTIIATLVVSAFSISTANAADQFEIDWNTKSFDTSISNAKEELSKISDSKNNPNGSWVYADGKENFSKIESDYKIIAKDYNKELEKQEKLNKSFTDANTALTKADSELTKVDSELTKASKKVTDAKSEFKTDPSSANFEKIEKAELLEKTKQAEKAKALNNKNEAQKLVDDLQQSKTLQDGSVSTELAKIISDSKFNEYNSAISAFDAKKDALKNAKEAKNDEIIKISQKTDGSPVLTVAKETTRGINENRTKIDNNTTAIGVNTTAIGVNTKEIKRVDAYAKDNRVKITQNTKDIKKNTKDIKNLKNDFKKLSEDFNDFKSQTNGAIAGVAAMSMLTQPYSEIGEYSVAVGVGAYKSESALALGLGYRYNEDLTLQGSLSINTADTTPIVAVSAGYVF